MKNTRYIHWSGSIKYESISKEFINPIDLIADFPKCLLVTRKFSYETDDFDYNKLIFMSMRKLTSYIRSSSLSGAIEPLNLL